LSNIFAVLAIFISCLGLLGLAMFTAEQRVKEIGIRKVLGASIGSLFTLLSAEFMTLIGMAIAIALPLAGMPPMAGCKALLTVRHYSVGLCTFRWLIIMIALLTISLQIMKAALG